MLNNSRILVIGGAGFVGSYINELLLKEPVSEIIVYDNFVRGTEKNLENVVNDDRVKVIKGDILDFNLLNQTMQGCNFVIHLAALWLLHCAEKPLEGFEVNCRGMINILECCKINKVKKLVFSSSASVYGEPSFIPITEEHPFNNDTMYGATKIADEQFCRSYHKMYGLDFVGLRYFNIYGPRQDDKGAYVSVIVKVMNKLFNNEQPLIYGDGKQAYDFIFVKDIARSNICALKSEATNEFYNIGFGEKYSINYLVRKLIEISGKTIEPKHLENEVSYVKNRLADVSKAQKELGFKAKIEIDEGLKIFYQWKEARLNHD